MQLVMVNAVWKHVDVKSRLLEFLQYLFLFITEESFRHLWGELALLMLK